MSRNRKRSFILSIVLLAMLIFLPVFSGLAYGAPQRPEPAYPGLEALPGGAGLGLLQFLPSNSPAPASPAQVGGAMQAAGDRLAALQNNDGGWDWELDDGNPASASPLNTVSPIGKGLAQAYLHTGDPDHRAALLDAGAFLLAKTNNFSPSDGYLAAQLDAIFGGTAYRNHVIANFYAPLAVGTYDYLGLGTSYNTAAYIAKIRADRLAQGIPNLASWDLGMGLVGAASCGSEHVRMDRWSGRRD